MMEESLVKALIVGIDQGSSLSDSDKAKIRARIALLEEVFKKEEQVEIKTTHHFSKDVYAREISVPKGTVLIGKIHKHTNLNILSKGEISIISIDGIQRMKAPCTIVSSPGVKRLAYVHEDTVWTTIHGTGETDLEKIEDTFIAKEYGDVAGITNDELKLITEAKDELGDSWSSWGDSPSIGEPSGEQSESGSGDATV